MFKHGTMLNQGADHNVLRFIKIKRHQYKKKRKEKCLVCYRSHYYLNFLT